MKQVSASKTALVIQCGRPFWPDVELSQGEVGEKALYGTNFHERAAIKLGNDAPLSGIGGQFDAEAEAHLEIIWPAFMAWLGGDNPLKIDWLQEDGRRIVEQSFAFNTLSPKAGGVRRVMLDIPTHQYQDLQRHEIAGTVDLAIYAPRDRALLVLDHKTGEWPGDPAELPQLLTLSLMLTRALKLGQNIRLVHAIHHAPRGLTSSSVVAKSVSPARLQSHAKDLAGAFERITQRTIRQGPECQFCPARHNCPTMTNALVALNAGPGEMTQEKAGAIHQALGLYADMAKTLRKQLHDYVAKHGPIERPDGMVARLENRSYSQLSMASIRRNLPPEEADRVIDMLESSGCIEQVEREELRARKR